MPQLEKKFFGNPTDNGLNADDAPFTVGINQWVNMENARTGTTDKGVVNVVESIGSTRLLSTPQPSVTFLTLKSVRDIENNRILYFKYNTTGPHHKIVCYSLDDQTEYDVMLSSQVSGGLSFSKNKLMDARIVNGILYWTDDLNEPRRINIDAGIKLNHPSYDTTTAAYTTPIAQQILTVIRRPPYFAPDIERKENVSFTNNFTANEAMQFAFRYRFREYEYSVVGPWSLLSPFNNPDEEFNYVEISMSLNEVIDQDVIEVELLVRFGNRATTGFNVYTWKAADIAAHNTGTALTYDYYNDITGIPISQQTLYTPFHSVPLRSKAIEIFRDRLALGNNVEGYDTPTDSSLSVATVEVEEGDDVVGEWEILTITYDNDGVLTDVDYYILVCNGISPSLYYFAAIEPPDVPPNPIDLGTATLSSSSLASLANQIAVDNGLPYDSIDFITNDTAYDSTTSGGSVALAGSRSFKSNGSYRVAVVFYDKYRRKSGVVFVNANKVTMPDRSYGQTVYNAGISWALSNTDAADEIPDWAYYYAIVRTDCLTTRFFTQARCAAVKYVTKDDDGLFVYTGTTYLTTYYGVAIDITTLSSFGMGYSFNEGDLCNLYFSAGVAGKQQMNILAQDGKWIILDLKDFGDVTSVTPLFEIYTPYKERVDEFYYEVGQVYAIENPATTSRRYSVINGALNGDVYLLERTDASSSYITEVMSPNDKFWQNWYSDIGWNNLIVKSGQVHKTNSISWSNTYIQGTQTNGLSAFDALDERPLPLECGPIQKLQITSKVQNELGIVMLAICTKETASLYIGEVQQYGSNAASTLVASSDVIGTINVLKGSFGTLNPESVVEFRGNVYWVDIENGKVIQYSSNGLFPISAYKMSRFWKLFSDQFNSMTAEEIEALGGRPFIFGGVDPHHNEVLFSIPKLLATPPKGYLPDYPSTIYPFDIWDGRGKTMVYKLDMGSGTPHWQGSYSFNPECFIYIQNKLFSFSYGHLYEHNQTDSYNEFYGTQYKSRIMFISNAVPQRPKSYNAISLEGNMLPSLTYFRSETPYEQASDLMDFDYRNMEGVLYATIYRNKITPTAEGFNTNGLLTGEKMRTDAMKCLLEFTVSTTPLELKFVNVIFDISRGHTT
jgi:hypothetical protein